MSVVVRPVKGQKFAKFLRFTFPRTTYTRRLDTILSSICLVDLPRFDCFVSVERIAAVASSSGLGLHRPPFSQHSVALGNPCVTRCGTRLNTLSKCGGGSTISGLRPYLSLGQLASSPRRVNHGSRKSRPLVASPATEAKLSSRKRKATREIRKASPIGERKPQKSNQKQRTLLPYNTYNKKGTPHFRFYYAPLTLNLSSFPPLQSSHSGQ